MLYPKTARFLSILFVISLLAGALVPATVLAQMARRRAAAPGHPL